MRSRSHRDCHRAEKQRKTTAPLPTGVLLASMVPERVGLAVYLHVEEGSVVAKAINRYFIYIRALVQLLYFRTRTVN